MTNKIYSSSNKVIGEIRLTNKKLEVDNYKKPPIIIIDDENIVNIYNSRNLDIDIALELYNDYNLCINEIAAIFGLFYNHVFNKLRYIDKAGEHVGRRNSSYGKKFSKHRIKNISNAHKGRITINNGIHESSISKDKELPHGWKIGRLPFSDSHKKHISETVKNQYNKDEWSRRAKKGWEQGAYKNVNFKKGIGGYITSKKINKRFFFRSLLELYYIIYYLEENNSVKYYDYEDITIKMDNGHLYTPDFKVNDTLIELKSYKFIYRQSGKIQENFEYKVKQAKKYCKKNNLKFKVIFDKDINFSYRRLIHELKETYIQKYNIEFLQPERVWSRK